LFQAKIPIWQRLNARGQVESLPHDQLTIYERWSHGGAWMSIETAAIHLSRLLRGAGLALVGEADGEVIAYAELYPGNEPAPFNHHLHLAHLVTAVDDAEVFDAMLRYGIELARSTDSGQLTLSLPGNDPSDSPYNRYQLQRLATVQRYNLSARTGQGFYKVNDHSVMPQIEDWQMPVGRIESARQHLELLWNRVWEIIPEIAARKIHRLSITASGHEAYLCCQTQLFNPRSIDVYLWSPRPLSPPLLTAIRDWSHRQNYRTLALVVTPETAKLLGTEAEADPYLRHIYAVQP
jgi:hypothetical protein